MDAREPRRPQPLLELAERGRAEVRAVVGVDAAVVAVGLDEVDLVVSSSSVRPPRDDGHLSTGRGVLGGALAQPLDDAREPLGVDRLQQVVERLDGERLDGVLAVRGDEDDGRRVVRARARAARRRARSGRASRRRGRRRRRRAARASASASAALAASPTTSTSRMRDEQVAQLRARRRLVVDDQRPDRHSSPSRPAPRAARPCRTGTSAASRPRRSAPSAGR